LPGDLPEYIEVDCGALEIGDSIHLSQLNLPEGVESAHLLRGGEDLGVVAIQKARGPAADEDESSTADSEGGEETAAEESEDKGESSEA
jgi:large subunit ribosomal protein L25